MPHPQRELASYAATFDKLQEQQQALYQQHVREIRELQGRLRVAEERAGGLEAQRAEDVVRIESWGTMAEALEAGGDEQQRQVATMGRRLTTLRVKEIQLSRQVSSQQSELKGLRAERGANQSEARAQVTGAAPFSATVHAPHLTYHVSHPTFPHLQLLEAHAQLARSERTNRHRDAALADAKRELAGTCRKEALDAEEAKHVALQRAYRSAVEQAARCAGAHHEQVRLEDELAECRERLRVAEAGAQSNAAAAQQAVAALQSLKEGAASGGGGRSGATTGAVLALEARLQALQISERVALSRAETAEQMLAEAQQRRADLAQRLQSVEEPVAQQRDALLEAHQETAALQQKNAELKSAISRGDGAAPAISIKEVEKAKAEATEAKERERVAVAQAAELMSRQEGQELEITMLRETVQQLQV